MPVPIETKAMLFASGASMCSAMSYTLSGGGREPRREADVLCSMSYDLCQWIANAKLGATRPRSKVICCTVICVRTHGTGHSSVAKRQ